MVDWLDSTCCAARAGLAVLALGSGAACSAPPAGTAPPTIQVPAAGGSGSASAAAGVRELSPEEAAAVGLTPAEKDDPPTFEGEQLEILITRAGALSVNGKRVKNKERLVEYAQMATARKPGISARLLVDGNVPYKDVVEVMDLLKQGGVEHIQLGVAARPPASGP
jgi:biopolymer transport protein ExbD